MKQIFTSFAILLISITQSFAQTSFSETFESKTRATLLTENWALSTTVDVNTGSEITGANTLRFDVGSSTTSGTITTPDILLLDQYVNVAFRYRSSALNPSGTRTIVYGFLNGTTFTTLGTINLANGNLITPQMVSVNTIAVPNTTVRLQFQLTGSSDHTTDLYIDDVRVLSNALAPLPIKLLSFTGSLLNNKAQLSWSVAENETGDRFEVEKSTDGRNYVTEAIVFTTDKTGTDNYYYKASQEIAANASYRLKIINKNNTTSYSRVIYLKKENGNSQAINLMQNPIGSSLGFTYDAVASGVAVVNLYNTAGLKVHSFQVNMQKGSNTVIQAMDTLGNGTYILEVTTTNERRTIKITK